MLRQLIQGSLALALFCAGAVVVAAEFELREDCPKTGVRQFLRILLWAAEISEERVERGLKELIEKGRRIRADEVWECLKQDQPRPEKWQVSIQPVAVGEYDQLLECVQEVAS